MDIGSLLIKVILICAVIGGLAWACVRFALPQIVQWIVGAVVIIVLIFFLLNITGAGTGLNMHTPIH